MRRSRLGVAAKARKRLAAPPPDREPKFAPWFPFEFGIREKSTGEMAFVDFVSVRDAARRLGAMRRYLEGAG